MNFRCALLLLALPLSALAQQNEAPASEEANAEEAKAMAALRQVLGSLKWQTGSISLPGGMASLELPDGYRFLDKANAKKVLVDIWGNPPGAASDALGMVFPRDTEPVGEGSWGIVVSFVDDGYVSDSDADKINYNDLLKQMKEGNKEASAQREKAGFGKMLLTGWALPPRYDKEKKVMYWAKSFDTGLEQPTVNYDVRVLGRKGILSLNGVASNEEVSKIDAATPEIVGMVKFNEGHRYADYNPSTDKKADYTLAGLVLGGAVAAKLLAKGGLLVLLAKFGKLLIIPVVVGAAFIKKLFTKRA